MKDKYFEWETKKESEKGAGKVGGGAQMVPLQASTKVRHQGSNDGLTPVAPVSRLAVH